ncbi:MAG: glycosyltransferase family 2 protein [bacterium]
MSVIAVVPAYNEEKTVADVVRGLSSVTDRVVVVDDGSTDRTGPEAGGAGATVVRHFINRGLGAAIGTGLRRALDMGGRIIVTFDADGQHRPEDVPPLIGPLSSGLADAAIGVRTLDRHLMPGSRRVANWIGNALTFSLFGLWVRDSQSGLRAFTAEAASRFDLHCDRMEVSSEIVREIRRHSLRLHEHPIRPVYTSYSLSKGQGFVVGLKTAGRLVFHRVIR